ncbi:MAG: tRNA (adenosine(37)-N6)-threonylcarbamoyltransferase complex dimerization subunit type 1 TsaB [Candidatus Poribacteria bacterium]|nr:tRNA (adenosine(37)-N6)-threonylcarbamoyltransferase complex dimerization subunit type 1 TsaB [Candidatus Poribacteria bacterium]MDE0506433.1 tRNA (adenosine(37)-N6)-threonylcarbamoyltransferase complex dimerization subunit type 1 TsaB [Candidatus Poribacteria bacterium]
MKILGIDTSTPIGSVGLIEGDDFIAEHTLNITQAHSSRLMPAIDQVLKWGDLTVHDVDACAVGIGPGSFTGVRIGVGTAKSLCYAIKKPIVGVSTLEAIAYNLRYSNGLICPILDARRDEVYGAVFHGGANLERRCEDLCLSIEALLNCVESSAVFVGDGLSRYAKKIRETFGDALILAASTFNVPRGTNIARIGREHLLRGESDDCFGLIPNYIRKGLYGKTGN